MLRMLDELIPVYGATGYVRERIGSATEYVVPHNHYPTRDRGWIAIACTNDRMFERLAVKAMGQPRLVSEFPTMAARLARRDEVDAAVARWVAALDATEALARLAVAHETELDTGAARRVIDAAPGAPWPRGASAASPKWGATKWPPKPPNARGAPAEPWHASIARQAPGKSGARLRALLSGGAR